MPPIEQVLPDAVRCDRLHATLSLDACRTRYRKSTQALTVDALWPCRQCPDGAARCNVVSPPPAPPPVQSGCERCGQTYQRAVRRSRYCAPCAKTARRERRRELTRLRSTRAETIVCDRCRACVPCTAGGQRFCATCGPVHHREQRAARARARAKTAAQS